MRTLDEVKKIVNVVDAGLVQGVGNPVPGHMCVEAAICYALGLPHSDDPICVSRAVRAFKITLNDAFWSSPHARAKGLRALAIAQLDSQGIDDVMFAKRLAELTIRKLLPIISRRAGEEEGSKAAARAAAAAAGAAALARASWAAADDMLILSANLALQVLREMRAPGVDLWDALVAAETR